MKIGEEKWMFKVKLLTKYVLPLNDIDHHKFFLESILVK